MRSIICTRRQARMENEDIRTRIITIENQMAQMMALLTDHANQVKNLTPVAPAAVVSTPNAPANAQMIDPVDKGPIEEVPVNATSTVVNLEDAPKESPVVHMDEESAKRLAKLAQSRIQTDNQDRYRVVLFLGGTNDRSTWEPLVEAIIRNVCYVECTEWSRTAPHNTSARIRSCLPGSTGPYPGGAGNRCH